MQTYERKTLTPVPPAELFAWHERPGAFERLAPPWERLRVVAREGGIRDGGRLVMQVKKGPLWLTWEALHRDYLAGRRFVDEQVRGPFAHWLHTHGVEPADGAASQLVDRVDYQLPLGWLGRLVGGRSTKRMLRRMFDFRHQRTVSDLTRHQAFAARGPQEVVISGASGMVGGALTSFLTTGGHRVRQLVRHEADAARGEIRWQPSAGEIDAAGLEGADVVVHLAGAGIADGRWTASRKALIRKSRVDGTRTLCEALARLERKPRVLISASAIGWYGDRGDAPLDESSAPGEGFLADVCRAWEDETRPASEAGIRVVNLRIGVVLHPQGGALAKMLPPFRAGAGGPVGGGRQWLSWITLDDLVGAIHFLMFADGAAGPVNAVAPEPVTQKAFARALGRALRRPARVPVPAFAIRALFGEMGEATVLASQRVHPGRLSELGYAFGSPELEPALRALLGR
ncbi:MAG: TIGR01777 family protein [Deltaproteobacteria bacterium]|nr:MAG: TIGR01777 family protein [Deltaproteobacteria bacterium]